MRIRKQVSKGCGQVHRTGDSACGQRQDGIPAEIIDDDRKQRGMAIESKGCAPSPPKFQTEVKHAAGLLGESKEICAWLS